MITSFKADRLREIKNFNPILKIGLLFYKEEVLANIWELAETIPLNFIGPFSGIISKELIDKAHALGKTVYAYHVNDKKLGEKLMAMGVDAIGTDYPKFFL